MKGIAIAVLACAAAFGADAKSFAEVKLSVQLDFSGITRENRAERLADMRKAGVDGLQIAFPEFFADGERRREAMENLGETIRYFENEGLTVCVWMSSLGYWGKRGGDFERRYPNARQLKSFSGNEQCYCATDPKNIEATAENVRDFLRAGAKDILFDDDLVQSCRPGVACVCDEHMRRYAARLHRPVTVDELVRSLTGAPNPVRTALFDVMGESLMDFCRAMRREADTVNPDALLGICASISHYDIDGVDFGALVQTLQPRERGKRAFIRLSGATYWPIRPLENPRNFNQGLGGVVEFIRWQVARFRGTDVVCMDENDTHPRDSEVVPPGMCEAYDNAMIAIGDVIRNKYMIRNNTNKESPNYRKIDPAYMKAHLEDMPADRKIAAIFEGARPVGFRVFLAEHFVREATMPAEYMGDNALLKHYSQPMAGIYLAANGVPTQYDRDDQPWASFGCGAVKMPTSAYGRGVLLDREAAEALAKKGVDVGLGSAKARKVGAWSLYANATGGKFAVWDKSMYEADYSTTDAERVPAEEIWKFFTGTELPVRVDARDGVYLIAKERPDGRLALLVENMRKAPSGRFTLSVRGQAETLELPAWGRWFR